MPFLYLIGDGVHNLLEAASLKALPKKSILAYKEDLEARGVQGRGGKCSEGFLRILS